MKVGGLRGPVLVSLLLASACSGGNNASGTDPAQPLDASDEAGIGDASFVEDGSLGDGGADLTDGTTGDADVDAGDAGADGGASAFHCTQPKTPIAKAAGGAVISDNGAAQLLIEPGELSADTKAALCVVPEDQVPSGIKGDGAVGSVYYLDSDAPLVTGTALVILSAVIDDLTTDAGIVPVALRMRGEEGKSEQEVTAPVMNLGVQPTVRGHVEGSGYLYVHGLDAYRVSFADPAADPLTGEIFSLGGKVSVEGAPDAARSLEVDLVGCNAMPLPPSGVTRAESSEPGCDNVGKVHLSGDWVDGSSADLTQGKVIDLGAVGEGASNFYCRFGGQVFAEAQLSFIQGSATDLVVSKSVALTCDLSTDVIFGGDASPVTTTGSTLSLDNDVAGLSVVRFVSQATAASFNRLGDDGVLIRNPTEGSELGASLISISGGSGEQQWEYDAQNVAGADYYPSTTFSSTSFYAGTGGALTFTEGDTSESLSCDVPSRSALGLQFGSFDGASTQLSFLDGAAELVHVEGVDCGPAGVDTSGPVLTCSGSPTYGFERFIRADSLELQQGRRTMSLLTAMQKSDASGTGATFDLFVVSLANAQWDEARAFWPGGRIAPAVCGFSVRIGPPTNP